MVLNKNDVKRLIIYFIYDKDGIVDDYIIYMLNALRQNASEIVAVVNGTLENLKISCYPLQIMSLREKIKALMYGHTKQQ